MIGIVGHAEILDSFWKVKKSYQSILSKRVIRLDEISYRKRILVAAWKIEWGQRVAVRETSDERRPWSNER